MSFVAPFILALGGSPPPAADAEVWSTESTFVCQAFADRSIEDEVAKGNLNLTVSTGPEGSYAIEYGTEDGVFEGFGPIVVKGDLNASPGKRHFEFKSSSPRFEGRSMIVSSTEPSQVFRRVEVLRSSTDTDQTAMPALFIQCLMAQKSANQETPGSDQ